MGGDGAEDPEEIDDDEIERIFANCEEKRRQYMKAMEEQDELAGNLIRCGFQPEEIEMALDEEEMVVFVYVKGTR